MSDSESIYPFSLLLKIDHRCGATFEFFGTIAGWITKIERTADGWRCYGITGEGLPLVASLLHETDLTGEFFNSCGASVP